MNTETDTTPIKKDIETGRWIKTMNCMWIYLPKTTKSCNLQRNGEVLYILGPISKKVIYT